MNKAWQKYCVSNDPDKCNSIPTPYQDFTAGWNAALDSLPKKRSNQYNKYYWKVVCGIPSKHTLKLYGEAGGYSPEGIHELHKDMFWDGMPTKQIKMGRETRHIKTTTILNHDEYDNWIKNRIIPYWASEDVMIWLPDEKELWGAYILESER